MTTTMREEQFWRQRAQTLRNLSCSSSSSSSSSLDVSKLLDRLDSVVYGGGCLEKNEAEECGFVPASNSEEEIENVRKCFQRTLIRHAMVREVEMDLLRRREIENSAALREGDTHYRCEKKLKEIFTTKKKATATKVEEPSSPEFTLSPDVEVETDENADMNKRKVRRRTPGVEKPLSSRSPLSQVNNRRETLHVPVGKPPRGNIKRARTTDDPFPIVISSKENKLIAAEDSYVCPFESSSLR
jgi:hypothetical protein